MQCRQGQALPRLPVLALLAAQKLVPADSPDFARRGGGNRQPKICHAQRPAALLTAKKQKKKYLTIVLVSMLFLSSLARAFLLTK